MQIVFTCIYKHGLPLLCNKFFSLNGISLSQIPPGLHPLHWPSVKRLMSTAEPDSISSLLSRQTVFFQFSKLMQGKCVIEINAHPVFSQNVIILPWGSFVPVFKGRKRLFTAPDFTAALLLVKPGSWGFKAFGNYLGKFPPLKCSEVSSQLEP